MSWILQTVAAALFAGAAQACTAVEIGFDPGLNKALAASLYPHGGRYVEFCPDSPTGRCYGSLPSGSGFYTLPVEVQYGYLADLPPALWQDFFQWKREDGELIAELVIDSRNPQYFATATPNLYNGLQLNLPIGDTYAGHTLSNPTVAPLAERVDHAALEFRAKTCAAANAPYFFTLHYYADFWSTFYRSGATLAFNYGLFWNDETPPALFRPSFTSQADLMRRLGLPEAEAQPYETTFFINAPRYGLQALPVKDAGLLHDPTPDCSLPLEAQPWRRIEFPIASFLRVLRYRSLIRSLDTYQYAGGIIAGIEQWGRARTVLQIRRHRLEDAPLARTLAEGHYRLPNATLWYVNREQQVCQYVNLAHAGLANAEDAPLITELPPSASSGWCPGAERIPLWD